MTVAKNWELSLKVYRWRAPMSLLGSFESSLNLSCKSHGGRRLCYFVDGGLIEIQLVQSWIVHISPE